MSTVKAQVFQQLVLASGSPFASAGSGSLRLIASGTGASGAGTPIATYTDRTGAGASALGLTQTDALGNLKVWVDKESSPFDIQRVSDNAVLVSGYELDPDLVTTVNGQTGAVTVTGGVTSVNGQTGAVTVTAASTLTPTATKTSAYTAAASDYVLADTTSAGFTVTLPASPADKAQVALQLTAGGNALTYAAGAGDTLGTTLSGSLPIVGEVLVVQYQSSAKVWRPVAARLPITQLDTRYASTASVAALVPLSTVTTKGDLIAGTGSSAVSRLAAGSNGQTLLADSTQTAGLRWATTASSSTFFVNLNGGMTSTQVLTAIQAQLDAAYSAGGGHVLIPNGVWTIDPGLKLRSGVWLSGDGTGTRLLLRAGAAAAMLVHNSLNTCNYTVSDLIFDGNRDNVTGSAPVINLLRNGNTASTYPGSLNTESAYPPYLNEVAVGHPAGAGRQDFFTLTVIRSSGHGITSDTGCSEFRFINCLVFNNASAGIAWNGVDSYFIGCTIGSSGQQGLLFSNQDNRATSCKVYTAAESHGNYAGYEIATSNQLTGCEAQECYSAALYVSGNNNSVVGFKSEGADFGGVLNGQAVAIGGSYNTVDFISRNFLGTAPYALAFGGSAVGNVIRCFLDNPTGTTTKPVLGSTDGNDVSFNAERGTQRVTFAATVNPDVLRGGHVIIDQTGNLTVGTPVNPRRGQVLTVELRQDATGGWTTTFGAGFVLPAGGNTYTTTAGAVNTVSFRYDGGFWVQTGFTATPGANVSDTFTRTVNPLEGSAADTGQVWQKFSSTGAANVNGTKLVTTAGNQSVWGVETGRCDGTVSVALTVTSGDNGIVVRISDPLNYLMVVNNNTGTFFYKVVNGTFTLIGVSGTKAVAGDTLSVVMNGSTLTCKVNGVTQATATDSFNSTATIHGVREHIVGGGTQYDNFTVSA